MSELPEVTLLYDARGGRTGAGEIWYEPEVWSLPLSPGAKVLYAGLCSYLWNGEINRRDLRNTVKGSSDAGIAAAFQELTRHGLLEHSGTVPPGYHVRSVEEFAG